ncbi:MAG: DNA-processing protein DprA [Oscillospiraceae bacterium]|nr:DNA-processing protein DprA [Oscillospiraceae bacterium]
MKYSDIALKVLVAKECGLIKTNAQFWTQFSEREKIEEIGLENDGFTKIISTVVQQFTDSSDEGFICAFDEEFPAINQKVKNSDKPYLLFYKGDINLLQDLNKNVAVIGLIDPTAEIEKREIEVVRRLVNSDLVIVSGLAKGCDSIAHKFCVDTNKKTIAILPTQINKISPAVNINLAKDIVSKGGLLLTEYYKESTNRQEAIGRYIKRDRLQAMFSKAVVLIASYRKGEGDSGSRHAIEAANSYGIEKYAMFNEATDINDKQFGLNNDLIALKHSHVNILQQNSIEFIKTIINSNLVKNPDTAPTQLELF